MNHNTIVVEKLVNGGYGLARREDGRIVLLSGVLPGEQVNYSITQQRRNTLFAKLGKVLTPHRQRIAPPCPYYGTCGGCDLQHCAYAGQLAIKKQILEDVFHGISTDIGDPVPSPQQFGYRQRIRLQVKGEAMGFYQFRSSDIVAIDTCLIAHPTINHVLAQLIDSKLFNPLRRHSSAAELLFDPGRQAVTLVLYYGRKPRPNDFTMARELAEKTECLESIFFQGESFALQSPWPENSRILSQELLDIHGGAFTLSWETGGFCQVNLQQNQNLIHYVERLVDGGGHKTVLDLFCGMGNFSIPLARSAQTLTGVEGQGAAIRCAENNSRAAGLDNTRFIKGPTDDVCRDLARDGQVYDSTVVDPPRQGVPQLAERLAALTKHSLIYVSCDPATLVRDIRDLTSHGFTLVSLQPFDMFPQTHHIETVAFLEKN